MTGDSGDRRSGADAGRSEADAPRSGADAARSGVEAGRSEADAGRSDVDARSPAARRADGAGGPEAAAGCDAATSGEFEQRVDWTDVSGPTVGEDLLPDHSFALCLTHDVDRPYKRVQAMYYALRDRDPRQLRALLPWCQPNWQFDAVLDIEEDLGVRSAFYFLQEQRLLADRPLRDLLDPDSWRLFSDRYSLTDPAIAEQIRELDARGWEVGLHGSYESYADRERLREEKAALESVLESEVCGGRQHYLNRRLPETWANHADVGLEYDATLGSSETYGFQYGDTVLRPFGDEFVVFPLTIMELALPDPAAEPERAWQACERVLREAADRGAIATVLWHPRVFNERDWPEYAALYRRLIQRALDLDAWVGPPGELYELLDHDDVEATELCGERDEQKQPPTRVPRPDQSE